jgi:hypothetical protein
MENWSEEVCRNEKINIDKVLDEDPRKSNEHPQINVLKVVIRPGSQGESQ